MIHFTNLIRPHKLSLLKHSFMCYKFDEVHRLLCGIHINFNVIEISVIRKSNINIKDYTSEHTPNESTCGGVLPYINNYLKYKNRNDFNLCK